MEYLPSTFRHHPLCCPVQYVSTFLDWHGAQSRDGGHGSGLQRKFHFLGGRIAKGQQGSKMLGGNEFAGVNSCYARDERKDLGMRNEIELM